MRGSWLRVAFLALTCPRTVGQSQRVIADEVHDLPGLQGRLCFRHFSGYLPTASPEKRLFYWYVQATEDSKQKPLLLWLNGGPGCSSLGGMWEENGPFVVDANGRVSLNPYSWNKVANILYIEQPAGVGFSYPAVDTEDIVTATDTYIGLLEFLKDFELQNREFYIAGESYGGHYVPNMAKVIMDGNAVGQPKVNLMGFAVGNPYTDYKLDFNANVPYARYHALCSPLEFAAVERECGEFTARCFWPNPEFHCPAACKDAVDNATLNALSIDIYDIYADVCPLKTQSRSRTQAFILEKYRRSGMDSVSPIFPTCAESFTATYLSRADVQRAIHAKPIKTWKDCGILNDGGQGKYNFNFESVLPLYRKWLQNESLKMLVYSGDADFIVNFLGTQRWVESLELPVRERFRAWTGSDGQVAGYVTDFIGLTFATVKGAGHMVPRDRPRHALDMISAFLGNRPLDKVQRVVDSAGPLCFGEPVAGLLLGDTFALRASEEPMQQNGFTVSLFVIGFAALAGCLAMRSWPAKAREAEMTAHYIRVA